MTFNVRTLNIINRPSELIASAAVQNVEIVSTHIDIIITSKNDYTMTPELPRHLCHNLYEKTPLILTMEMEKCFCCVLVSERL